VKTLVIGGTGPTGPFIVNGLLRRGHEVAILHTGRHEVAEIPSAVEHIHTDPFDANALMSSLEGRRFDLTIASYGRLRVVCEVMRGKTDRFISVGGVPAYRGYSNPGLLKPNGLPVPVAENWDKVIDRAEDEKGYRVFRSESLVFEHHPGATHFRYPLIYGPYQLVPREWCIVKRILDRRPHIVLPDEGLTLHHCGYAENVAHAVLLAVDQPKIAAGQIYNCGDAEALTLRQVVDVIAEALGHTWEVVSIPYELAACTRPLVAQPWNTHRVFDLTKLRSQLGYADVVPPPEAFVRTARWLIDHPPRPGGSEERNLQDPFDYEAEDALIAAWKRTIETFPRVSYRAEPGYTNAYSGPGSKARKPE
jgi:nucleoside-diphosphate-sugar epimerase